MPPWQHALHDAVQWTYTRSVVLSLSQPTFRRLWRLRVPGGMSPVLAGELGEAHRPRRSARSRHPALHLSRVEGFTGRTPRVAMTALAGQPTLEDSRSPISATAGPPSPS